jgi:hypothetical protein
LSSQLNYEKLRRKILDAANAKAPEWLSRNSLIEALKGTSEDEMDHEVYYLEEKKCLRHRNEAGSHKPWTEIQITAEGIQSLTYKPPDTVLLECLEKVAGALDRIAISLENLRQVI